VRLDHAYRDVRAAAKSVTEIALDNDFPNTGAFIAAFREAYGQTPGEYRKTRAKDAGAPRADVEDAFLQPVSDAFRTLTKYAEARAEAPLAWVPPAPPAERVERIRVADGAAKARRWEPTWKNLLTLGCAKELLLAPVQEQILQCQREIGFRYVRFHGLLDDDMQVYREDAQGQPVYNFTYLDMLFDFILSAGLTPYVEFSFMPSALARLGAKMPFQHASVVSLPADMDKWKALVRTLVAHWMRRYGSLQTSAWKFVAVNAYWVYLGYFTMREYAALYRETRAVVKELLPDAEFDGPGCDIGLLGVAGNHDWEQFFDACAEHGGLPDFISVQCFHVEYRGLPQQASDVTDTHETAPVQISGNENYLADALKALRGWLRHRGIHKPRIWLETWNSTMWQRDLCNDTCFKAAFLAKNILQNAGALEAMGYWTASDFMEEIPAQQELFHGGYGLFTYNGIPKSGYYALWLLRRMEGEWISHGADWALTRRDGKLRLAMFNYCHYDQLYQRRYMAAGDVLDRYGVFVAKGDSHILFQIQGVAPGEYDVETYSVSPGGGSSFDAWVRMGAPTPAQLRPTRQEYLRSVSLPRYTVERKAADGDGLALRYTVRPHEFIVAIIHGA
jgi:xylan 1,4-beta-xylosidase